MPLATVILMHPFQGTELIEIERHVDVALWRVTSIPLFSEDVCYGDIVAIAYRTMFILDVITPSGLTSRGGVYDPLGSEQEIEDRFVEIVGYLGARGIRAEGKGPGLFMMAVPRAIDDESLAVVAADCPVKFDIGTQRTRAVFVTRRQLGCG